MLVDLLLRWIHVVSAAILAGGLVFWWSAAAPALSVLDTDQAERPSAVLRRRWGILVGVVSGLLLASGLINAVLAIRRYQLSPVYHGLVAIKLIVALGVFYIAAKLCGRSPSARRFQENTFRWLTVSALLAIALILIGGYMRWLDHVPKDILP